MRLNDSRGRPLRDLRISVTDRCNFRCTYCMPREHFGNDYQFLAKEKILTYEEITTIVSSLLPLGIEKIRLTGGEPLMRRNVIELVRQIRALDSRIDIAITTNGILLEKYALQLKEAGLSRVTVSLDALENEVFQSLSDTTNSVDEILQGIEFCRQIELPVKVNCVIQKGVNESQIVPIISYFNKISITPRFIEFMDVGTTNSWNYDSVVSGDEMRKIIELEFGQLEKVESNYPGEVANLWKMKNGSLVGFIESVTKPFCGDCSRARLSAEGSIYTCLFATEGHNIRSILRMDASQEQIGNAISDIWKGRNDNYSEQRGTVEQSKDRVEMSYIGG
ncbi:MAG: GTP 3',8-cyclase MoaA [Candidatus Poseidoniaceae archaeon]|jgi:cyclic pyranopterin phosphate synthase